MIVLVTFFAMLMIFRWCKNLSATSQTLSPTHFASNIVTMSRGLPSYEASDVRDKYDRDQVMFDTICKFAISSDFVTCMFVRFLNILFCFMILLICYS